MSNGGGRSTAYDNDMFGCSEHWLGKRFSHALTSFLNGEKRRTELNRRDGLDAGALEERYASWRIDRAAALKVGGAAAAYALADAMLPETSAAAAMPPAWTTTTKPVPLGKLWSIPSTPQTVNLGQFDPTRPPIVTVDSGDVISYTNTWTHFLNKLQPGVAAAELAAMRRAGVGRGVHSVIGPIAVNGAKPGDML